MAYTEARKRSNDKHYHEKVKTNPAIMERRRQNSFRYYYEKVKPFKEIQPPKQKKEKPFKEVKKRKEKEKDLSVNIVNKPIVLLFE